MLLLLDIYHVPIIKYTKISKYIIFFSGPKRNASGQFIGSSDPAKKAASKRRNKYERQKTLFTKVAEMVKEHDTEAVLILKDKKGKVTFGATDLFKGRLQGNKPILTQAELSSQKKLSKVDMAGLIQKAKSKPTKKSKASQDLTPSKGTVFTSWLPRAKDQILDLSQSVVCPDSSPEKATVTSPQSKPKKQNPVRKRLNTIYVKKSKKSKQD